MKKAVMILLAAIILNFSSCETADDMNYSYSIKDALKISAWVLDESFDVNGYWVADENIMGHGWWVESDEKTIDSDEEDIFVFERLKLNEVRTMAPSGYMSLVIYFEFDGIIEVENEHDEHMLLSYDGKNPSAYVKNGVPHAIFGEIKLPYAVYVYTSPMESYVLESDNTLGSHAPGAKVGREHYLNVNAYNFGNEQTPVIRAKLKLAVLEDESLPSYYPKDSSRLLSVELISYEYSERYIILDELWEDDAEDD